MPFTLLLELQCLARKKKRCKRRKKPSSRLDSNPDPLPDALPLRLLQQLLETLLCFLRRRFSATFFRSFEDKVGASRRQQNNVDKELSCRDSYMSCSESDRKAPSLSFSLSLSLSLSPLSFSLSPFVEFFCSPFSLYVFVPLSLLFFVHHFILFYILCTFTGASFLLSASVFLVSLCLLLFFHI